MPRAYLMSWEGSPYFRWVKMWKGSRHRVGCHELPITREQWTKEASAPAANHWWETKRAELETAKLDAHPQAERIKKLNSRLAYAKRNGLEQDASPILAELRKLECNDDLGALPIDDTTLKVLETLETVGYDPLNPNPVFLQAISPTEAIWDDRLKRESETPTEKTIGANAARWVKDRRDEARQGVRSHEGADALERGVKHFTDFAGTSSPVDAINFDFWQRWFTHCSAAVVKHDRKNGGWSADTAQKFFTISKTFVQWLYQSDRLGTLPKNFVNKSYKFERPAKSIPVFSDAEIAALVKGAVGIHRLLLLLMLNCGMTQQDIADLRRDEVAIDRGRLTRRRSKTRRKKSSVLVSYLLWPETQELLREHIETSGDLALVTKSGKPWVWSETTDAGKLKSSDNVATIFANLKRKLKIDDVGKSLKVFRKTSATRLKNNREYKDARFMFLGHSERTVTDRHYAEISQDTLDAAVKWLRTQYTF